MGIFSNSKEKEELALVFDIGSSSVGGAMFLMQDSGVPKMLYSFREPIVLEQKVDFDRLLLLTLKSLDLVSEKIYRQTLGVPKNIFCVLSSPWYASQTRTIKLEKNTPFLFSSKLADSLIQKEIALFEEEHLDKNIEATNKFKSIEVKNIKTVLNGYITAHPLNKKTKEIEMTLFISMSPAEVLKALENTIMQYFHFKDIKFSSFVMASFVVVRDMFVHQDNFLLVDIGGEVTDISMIKNNVLHESMSFPIGPSFIIRGIAKDFNCTLSEARSYLSLYKDGHADDKIANKLNPIINRLKTSWLHKFQESLANLSHDISIPATIFVTVDKDFVDLFGQTIKNEQFNQYTLTESKFEIIFLDAGVFHGTASFKDDSIRDPFLIIESIYINRFFH